MLLFPSPISAPSTTAFDSSTYARLSTPSVALTSSRAVATRRLAGLDVAVTIFLTIRLTPQESGLLSRLSEVRTAVSMSGVSASAVPELMEMVKQAELLHSILLDVSQFLCEYLQTMRVC